MWTKFPSEAWRKTVLRRCAKRIPILDEMAQRTMEADDQTFEFDPTDVPAVDPQSVVADQPSASKTENRTDEPQQKAPAATPVKRARSLDAVVASQPKATIEQAEKEAKDSHEPKTAPASTTEQEPDEGDVF
jgi:recombinational DNA repair protein RecT